MFLSTKRGKSVILEVTITILLLCGNRGGNEKVQSVQQLVLQLQKHRRGYKGRAQCPSSLSRMNFEILFFRVPHLQKTSSIPETSPSLRMSHPFIS